MNRPQKRREKTLQRILACALEKCNRQKRAEDGTGLAGKRADSPFPCAGAVVQFVQFVCFVEINHGKVKT
jgi:hypothetical protein